MDTSIPEVDNVLKVQLINEQTATKVESVILDADSQATAGTKSTCRFVLVQKGNVLAPNGRLLFKLNWAEYSAATDAALSCPRFSGALGVISEARLFCGGLIEQNKSAGQKIFIESLATPYDAQNEIQDELLSGNHGYTYDANGLVQLTSDVPIAQKGTRVLTNNTEATVEVSVPIDELFTCLKDIMIPTFLRDPIVVEVDFDLSDSNTLTASGAAAPGAGQTISVTRPRLSVDYLTMPEPIVDAMRERFMSPQGVAYSFRQANLVTKAVAGGQAKGSTVTNEFELGFAGQRVTKILMQNQLPAANNMLRNCRSTGLYGQELQVFINNQTLWSRSVDRLADMYSYLSQTYGSSAKLLPATYELVGELAANNELADTAILPQKSPNVATTGGMQGLLQGGLRYLGCNLAQSRGSFNDPANALLVGDSPIVVRYTRSFPANAATTPRGEADSADQLGALNVKFFVETVRTMTIANGQIQVSAA